MLNAIRSFFAKRIENIKRRYAEHLARRKEELTQLCLDRTNQYNGEPVTVATCESHAVIGHAIEQLAQAGWTATYETYVRGIGGHAVAVKVISIKRA